MLHKMTKDSHVEKCIDHCRECSDLCLETAQYCLEKGGKHAERNHQVLLQICAQICNTSAFTMLLGSDEHPVTCGACAKICEDCAGSCEKFSNDDMLRICAETCRKCASSCYEMAGSLSSKR